MIHIVRIIVIFIVISFLLSVISFFIKLFFPILVIVVIAGLFSAWRFFRCPNCGHRVKYSDLTRDEDYECPNCGATLKFRR